MNFKKLPFTTLPIIITLIIIGIFAFILPDNADLISPQGDYFLGQAIMGLFLVCIVIDIVR